MLLVDLVDEHFVRNARLDIVRGNDELSEPHTSVLVVLSLSVNHIDQCATVTHHCCLIRLESVISREVHHAELNVRIVIHLLLLNLSGRK